MEKLKPPDWKDYQRNPKEGSCEKGGHKERSIVSQPNHLKHWNKVTIFRWKPK